MQIALDYGRFEKPEKRLNAPPQSHDLEALLNGIYAQWLPIASKVEKSLHDNSAHAELDNLYHEAERLIAPHASALEQLNERGRHYGTVLHQDGRRSVEELCAMALQDKDDG